MHSDAADHPGRNIHVEMSPLHLSERERASLLDGPTLRVELEIEGKKGERTTTWTVGTFPRAMLCQFSSHIADFVAKEPSAAEIFLASDVKPIALAYMIDWMMESCTNEKVRVLPMTMDLNGDLDIYSAAVSLQMEEVESAAGNALNFFIDSCAWDLDAYATMVNRLPVKSRVMGHLLLVTLHLCHEDMLDEDRFEGIHDILQPLPLVRKRMRELDQSIEDPEEDGLDGFHVEGDKLDDFLIQGDDGMHDSVVDDEMDLDDKDKPGPGSGLSRPQSRMAGTFVE